MDIDTKEGMEQAKAWLLNHLSLIHEGGTWLIPRVCSVYTVSHKDKTLTRTGLMPDTSTTRVAEAIGWKVIEGNPE